MHIYQLKTAKQVLSSENIPDRIVNDFDLPEYRKTISDLMHSYAEDVAKRFAAECVNEALGNKMEVSNSLHHAIENKYKSIVWNSEV
jgi:hypothetical protein